MTKSKQIGTQWEGRVVDLAKEHGFVAAHRLALGGSNDVGDVWIDPRVVVEAKATRAIDLAGAMKEATTERLNAGAAWAVVAQKRRNHPADRAYGIMELGPLLDLLGAVLL